jgi:hypothetical protein
MAKQQSVGKVPTIQLQPTPTIHEHQAGKSIKQAINNANQHVANVNAASKGK